MSWKDDPAVVQPKEQGGWQSDPVYTPPPDNIPEVKQLVENAPGMKEANTWDEALSAGWQHGATGYLQKKPNLQLPENAGFMHRLWYGLGQGAGDLPFQLGGGAVAAAIPGVGETGVPVLAAAGATPEAVRQTMMDVYSDDRPHTAADISAMIAKNVWEVTKGAASMVVGGKFAKAVGGHIVSQGGSAFVKNTGSAVAFVSSSAIFNSVMNGKMPDWEDFGVAAVLGLGFHALSRVAPNLRAKTAPGTFQTGDTIVQGDEGAFNRVRDNLKNIYRTTGVPPWQAVNDAKQDPKLRDEILGQDVNGDPVTPKFNATRPEEVEPYKTTPGKISMEHQQEVGQLEGEAHVRAHVETLLPQVRHLEGSADDAVSPKGAVGRYQIMPGTARQYGFDPSRLTDPAYNEMVARTVLADLSRRFHGDSEAVLIAYNAGPGRAFKFLRDGRNVSELPPETQRYIAKANLGGAGGEPPEPPAGQAALPPPDDNGMRNWASVPLETRISRFENQVGEEPVKEKSASLGMQFELTPLHKVDQMLATEGVLDPDKDVGIEDMARMRYGSMGRAESFLTYRPVDALDFNKKVDGPTLDDVMKEVDKVGSWREFATYVSSLRSVVKGEQGIKSGLFEPGEAEQNIKDLQGKYAKVNELFQEYHNGVLQYGFDSGLYSAEQMKAMQDKNMMAYISFRRIMGDDKPFTYGGKGPLARNRNPLRRMEGSDRDIVDQRLSTIDNTRKLVMAADTNRFLGSVINSTRLREQFGLKQIAFEPKAMLAEPGSDVFKPYHMDASEEAAVQHLAVRAEGLRGDTFIYYNNGKPELWRATNEDMARLVRTAASTNELTVLGKVMQLPAALDRAGVVSTPDFGFRVGLKHQMNLWVTDPSHPPPLVTMVRGLWHVLGKTEEYERALRNGALDGVITDIDKVLTDQETLSQTGVFNKAWNVVATPLRAAQLVTETLSNSARIGAMQHIEATGVDSFKAAMRARKGMLDYKEQLTSNDARLAGLLQTWARWVPFFRPAALGIRNVKEAILERPKETMARVALGLILPQIGLYALNRAQDETLPEDQKYVNLPQWERDQYYVLPQVGGVRVKIPKMYVLGPIFGTLTERLLETTFEQNPHAWDDVIGGMTTDVFPAVIPAAVKPIIEQQANYNSYTGFPLVSDSLKGRTRDLQWTDNTTEIAKKISQLVGGHDDTGVGTDSPPVIENYVRGWSGTMGMTVLSALSAPLSADHSPFDIAETPFLKSFLVRNPGMNARPIEDFYKEAEHFIAVHKDVRAELESDPEQAKQDANVGKYQFAQATMRGLHVMRAAVHAVNTNTKMTDDEKRQLEERIYIDAIRAAKFGLSYFHGTANQEEGEASARQITGDLNTTFQKAAQ